MDQIQRERDYYSKNQFWIFHHTDTVIETCFEMLKSSEHEQFLRLFFYVRSADSSISFYY